jgi:hypothetical protein
MDTNVTLIIIVIIFALVVLAWALLFRKKGKASIKAGPVEMTVEGENQVPAPAHETPAPGGVTIENARAGGGILAEASDGGGVRMKGVTAEEDILASASTPDDAPKV